MLEKTPTPTLTPAGENPGYSLTPSDLAYVWFEVALESPEAQQKYLGKAIDQFETFPGAATDETLKFKIVNRMGDFLLGNNAELNLKAQEFLNTFKGRSRAFS